MSAELVLVEEYSEKSCAMFGNTKKYADDMKELGGRFNPGLKLEGVRTPGWIFSRAKLPILTEFIKTGKITSTKKKTPAKKASVRRQSRSRSREPSPVRKSRSKSREPSPERKSRSKSPPSNKKVQKFIAKFIKKEGLENTTTKMVKTALAEKYPNHTLTSQEINAMIKEEVNAPPKSRSRSPSPQPRARTPSPQPRARTPSPKPRSRSPSPTRAKSPPRSPRAQSPSKTHEKSKATTDKKGVPRIKVTVKLLAAMSKAEVAAIAEYLDVPIKDILKKIKERKRDTKMKFY